MRSHENSEPNTNSLKASFIVPNTSWGTFHLTDVWRLAQSIHAPVIQRSINQYERVLHTDSVLQRMNGTTSTIQEFSEEADPLQYPLLLPYGTYGWDKDRCTKCGRRVTCRDYYAYMLRLKKWIINLGNISSNCKSSSFAFPQSIPEKSTHKGQEDLEIWRCWHYFCKSQRKADAYMHDFGCTLFWRCFFNDVHNGYI